jgi:hypothetical protein
MDGEKLEQLREIYRNLLDGELLSLAADAKSLTDVARQVLQEEMARRGLNELDVPEYTKHASEDYSGVPRRGNKSGFLSILKKSGWAVILGIFGLFLACARFHLFPNGWMVTAFWFLILPLMVIGAILELLRIRKKEHRRERLAIACGLDKKR